MNVLAALLVLALLIVVHEAGHFLAATLQGIRVSGFSIGFGPALIKKQRRGVTYALRLFPLGGFVAFPDDDEESTIPADDPDLLRNRPIPQQALVVAAGVMANLALALVVLLGQAAFVGVPAEPEPGVLVVQVQPDGAAARSGLRAGDQILSLNTKPLTAGQRGVESMVRDVKAAPQQSIRVERKRGDETTTVQLIPDDQQGMGKIGAQLQANISGEMRRVRDPWELVLTTGSQFTQLLQQTVRGYAGLLTNFRATAGQVSGPVKIVEMGAQLSQQGGSGLVLFSALISINLAVLNSLPLPLLDGWQMMMLAIQSVRGRPVSERIQMAFAQSGFLLLVGLTLVLIVRDTSQLPVIQQLMGR
ncbi:RIP metalloprotease RseP [Synechococcus sp. PROS-U-1]|uniref:RIP metalloprotease RseP n=1 Tax=Synechococcus sp. PROS-U-1 TaxID=1400866 RepID=UPI0016466A38|nr:RIP metalloprotease RseP [Synechococcus sp. PROS-U-1]QNJ02339.1 RIP metalloprotease RseP [Synechococcus sp. PROS-U-1]